MVVERKIIRKVNDNDGDRGDRGDYWRAVMRARVNDVSMAVGRAV